jgi:hypothetical protein
MKRLIMKSKKSMFPTVVWQGSQLVVFYLGEDENEVEVRETNELNFEEFFLHLDRGGSVFVTMMPNSVSQVTDSYPESEVASELLQKNM